MSETIVSLRPRERPRGSGKRGRPRHEPTEELRNAIRLLRANGCNVEVIAKLVHLTRRTIKRHYRDELEFGREELTAVLGMVIVNAALNGSVRAAIWWLERFGGPQWKRTEVRLHGGMEGAPPARARVIIMEPRPAIAPPEVAAVVGEVIAGS